MVKTHKVALLGGDGTGPEVARESQKVIDVAAKKYGFKINWQEFDWGGDRYLKTGEVLPAGAADTLRQFDAILLGAIGHPDVKPGILEKGILLKLRFELQQYINLRPVKLYPGVWTPLRDKGPEHIDFVVVRENNEGLYTGAGGIVKQGTPEEVAIQTSVSTRAGCDRCLKFAFELTRRRNKNKQLTLVGKTNVLTFEFDLWERAFHQMGEKYPDIKRDYNHVDACCMWFVKNPEWYDVIVTNNIFGDIITDLGAMIQGGMGIAAGGNLNPDPGGVSMYEPIGGSAPKYTGKNVINPMAAIGAGAMLLEYSLGENEAAKAIERAMMKATSERMQSQAAGKMGMGTTQVGDMVAQMVADGI
ncbi:MAG: 3-isopropylmalate dehydrogenase [Deltaproteobacteria bacterium]|nr:3-isopropylmalate dehydrogenase [Deltaproteobacteria bacterium]